MQVQGSPPRTVGASAKRLARAKAARLRAKLLNGRRPLEAVERELISVLAAVDGVNSTQKEGLYDPAVLQEALR